MPKRKRAQKPEPLPNDNQQNHSESAGSTGATFEVANEGKKSIACERHGSTKAVPDILFTHGAGGGLTAPAMQDFAAGFATSSSLVMFRGNMNLKARVAGFHAVIEHEKCPSVALGGRSMGARAACLAAQEGCDGKIDALVLVSFPLVGAQKGDSREQILLDLRDDVDVLFIAGSKDSMCDVGHLREVIGRMKARSWIVRVEGADHGMSLKPKAGSQPMRVETGEVAARWLKERDRGKRSLTLTWDHDDQNIVSTGWEQDQTNTGVAEPSSRPVSKRRKKAK